MQRMGIIEEAPGRDEAHRVIEAATAEGAHEHGQRIDDDPADHEGHGDAPEPVGDGAARAVALSRRAAKKPAMT